MNVAKENVAVLFISGQSNAHAHQQCVEESERIVQPMKNVFGLDRNPNQSFDITDVVWSGFTGEGTNLGETQDHTYSLAYYVAKRWQRDIDEGKPLPDLYIVQISIGSQGIINGMWNSDKEQILKPGTLNNVDISLYPLALKINELAISNLKKSGKNPIVIGWHWIGSEQDVRKGGFDREDFLKRYDDFFDSMLQSIGEPCPLYLYKLYLEKYFAPMKNAIINIQAVNDALYRQCTRYKEVHYIESENSPHWDETDAHNGIFAEDNAHYLAKVQKWFADSFFEILEKKYNFKKEQTEDADNTEVG